MHGTDSERGAGAIKNIILIVLVLYGIYVAVKVVDVKADDAAMAKGVESMIRFAGVNRDKLPDLEYKLEQEMKKLEIPATKEDFKVLDEGKEWHVVLKYKRELKLGPYTYRRDIVIDQTAPK